MTIPRMLAINRYHKKNPPLHIMVATYLEAGKDDAAPNTTTAAKSGLNSDGESLFDLFPTTRG